MVYTEKMDLPRRTFFRRMGTVSLIVAGGGRCLFPAQLLAAEPNLAATANTRKVEALIKEQMGDAPITYIDGLAEIPEKADNAKMVRVFVHAEPPMDPGHYVQSVAVFVDNNPRPFTSRFDFIAEMGLAKMDMRVKMSRPSPIRVIVKTSQGKLYGYAQSVEVAIGQCEA